MNYFRYFPTVTYRLGDHDVVLTDITARIKIVQKLQEHVEVFYDYVIQEGDRPDSVATTLYGSPSYTWIILVMNNIMSLYDWPLSYAEFTRYIIDKYGSVSAAQALKIYHTADNDVVDVTTFNLLDVSARGTITTQYDEEHRLNDAKRRIKVLPVAFVEPLIIELQRLFT